MDSKESNHTTTTTPTNLQPPPIEASIPPTEHSIFTKGQKAFIVAIVSTAATFSGFASNIYFPALPTIAADLSVSAELVNLTVTSYMIFQGIAPSFWGAVADVKGRRVTYICTFLVFFGACIGLANTKNYATLVALRCLQSTGSASTIAIGSGVIGDITTRAERGGYMGVFQAGLLVPVAVGPVLGGVFANTLGWRAIFWFLTIYSGLFLIILTLLLPETLRSIVGDGSIPASGVAKYPLAYIQRRHQASSPSKEPMTPAPVNAKPTINILGPLHILISKEVILIVTFLAIYYTVWQMSITVMSTLFKATYGLSEIAIGLTFMANGVGSMLGTLLTGKLLDIDYRRIKSQCTSINKDFPLERARLRTLWFWSIMQCGSVLVFGWTLDRHVHISLPVISTFFLGWAATSTQSVVMTFLVDVFPSRSASASAALNLARCLMGAAGTAAAIPIIHAIGIGWTFVLLTGVMCAGLGLVVLQMKYGPRWRQEREEKERA